MAMPSYLSHAGYSLAELSVYGSIITLPWATKVLVGPFMDRFTYLPMGFRRPWVIGTQTGLLLSMVLFWLVCIPGDPSLSVIITLGFICSAFSASQDVATDGMAISLLHEDERGKANAFMGFGQTVGFSGFAAVSGYLLVTASMAMVAAVAAFFIGLILAIAILTREQLGEKVLPWTKGEAVEAKASRESSFLAIFKDLVKVLFLPMSLLLILMELFSRMRDGIAFALIPKYAQEVLHVATDDYTNFIAMIGIVSAVVGVAIGPLIDKFGAKKFLFIFLLFGAGVHVAAWYCSSESMGLNTMSSLYVVATIASQIIFVALIAIFMTICWKKVAATQFSIYMSLANLGRTIGSAIFAVIAPYLTFQMDFLIMAGLMVLAALVVSFFNAEAHLPKLRALDQ